MQQTRKLALKLLSVLLFIVVCSAYGEAGSKYDNLTNDQIFASVEPIMNRALTAYPSAYKDLGQILLDFTREFDEWWPHHDSEDDTQTYKSVAQELIKKCSEWQTYNSEAAELLESVVAKADMFIPVLHSYLVQYQQDRVNIAGIDTAIVFTSKLIFEQKEALASSNQNSTTARNAAGNTTIDGYALEEGFKNWMNATQYRRAAEEFKDIEGSMLYHGQRYLKGEIDSEQFDEELNTRIGYIKEWETKNPQAAESLRQTFRVPLPNIAAGLLAVDLKRFRQNLEASARIRSYNRYLDSQIRSYDNLLEHPIYDSLTQWVDEDKNVHPR